MKETDPVGFVPGPGLPWIAGLSVLPFFLQFLGLGLSERLGQGLCGSALGISEAEAVRYGLVSEYYFYGQLFLILLSLKVTYALALMALRFMYPDRDPPFAPLVWRLGVGLSLTLLLLFLLTRTLPLPFSTPLGPALLAPRSPGPPFPHHGPSRARSPLAFLEAPPVKLPPLVYLLGLVSFLMDVASEMVYPLLPLFLAGLGATPTAIGLVEGVAEATASLFKVVGGRLSRPHRQEAALPPSGLRPPRPLPPHPGPGAKPLARPPLPLPGPDGQRAKNRPPGCPHRRERLPGGPGPGLRPPPGPGHPGGHPGPLPGLFALAPFGRAGGLLALPPSPPLWRPSFSFF
jgi:hypothetical protein